MRLKVALAAALIATVLSPGARAAAAPTLTLDGVPVDLDARTSQVITVRGTGSTTARVSFWDLRDGQWHLRARSTTGRTGYGGLVDPTTRVQGTGTTPTGTYYLPYTFGADPKHLAWRMPYRDWGGGDYWVEDNASVAYNRWRARSQGGFRWWLTDKHNGSERLADYPGQYRMAVVVAYNYYAPVRHRGAGIFLHVNGPGATAGCVSAPAWFLRTTLALLDPAKKPVVAIGRR